MLALIVAGASAWLSSRLEIRADFANLLPPSRQSVRDLATIKERIRTFATMFVVVEADDPAVRAHATRSLYQRLQRIDRSLIANLAYDDGRARRFLWENRFLLVGLEDLTQARDALQQRIDRAKLAANPLYIDLEDFDDEEEGEDDSGGAGAGSEEQQLEARIESLKTRLDEVEARANAPPGFVSRTGKYQLVIIRATFNASEAERGEQLLAAVHTAIDEVKAEHGAAVNIGITGDAASGVYEHRAILHGMVLAAAVTILIVALALILYYRSALSVMAILWALTVGSIATFGVTELTIGHLNMATAFLAAIVVGNGINPGLILMARYFEEVRRGHHGVERLARAVVGATRGTLAASLTAGVAYASLIVTDFRGFRHFGIIGGVGMVLCWIATFTVLPAALAVLERRIKPRREPAIGRFLAAILPGNLRAVVIFGAVITALSGYMTWHYLASNPLEEDWRNLRSTGPELSEYRYWDDIIRNEFDQGFNRNLSGRFVVAMPERGQVAPLIERLRAVDKGKAAGDELFLYLASYEDLVPPAALQEQKLAVLDQIRELITDDVLAELEPEDRRLAERIRPPGTIERLTDARVPDELSWPFVELDGTRGRLIHAASGPQFDIWNVRHLVAFANHVRALELPEHAVLGGQTFVFADLLTSMEKDGPLATLVALVGSVLAIWLVIGFRRHGLVTLLCATTGTLGMIALVSLWGLKVNFLDFIALPITVGIGIDYAVNIAARDRQDDVRGPRHLLTTTGGAVFLCSFTTTVGYGSLLLSDNAGIRSFGLAAILGELSCMVAALLLAPALLSLCRRAWRAERSPRPSYLE